MMNKKDLKFLAWLSVGGLVVLGLVVAGGYAGNEQKKYREEHQWIVGETRNGITLVSIEPTGWRGIAVFSEKGTPYEVRGGGVRMFSNGDVIKVLKVEAPLGYILAEVS